MSKDSIDKVLQQAQTPVLLVDTKDGLVIPVSIDSSIVLPVTVTPTDYFLEIAQGNIAGQASVNKFGRSTNVDSGISTDIWDRANAADDQDIWLAPTAARIHTIASGSASDNTGGIGANSIVISYLPDWNTRETTEIVTGNLNAGIAMANAAVMINRMEVLVQATSTSANVGTITATAAIDGTVTAQINPGEGQTQMAIYGIPSIQVAYMVQFYVSILRSASSAAAIDGGILFNPIPNVNPLVFIVKHTTGKISTGTSDGNPHGFEPYNKFAGPGILKIQAAGSANNLDVSAGFDLILVDN